MRPNKTEVYRDRLLRLKPEDVKRGFNSRQILRALALLGCIRQFDPKTVRTEKVSDHFILADGRHAAIHVDVHQALINLPNMMHILANQLADKVRNTYHELPDYLVAYPSFMHDFVKLMGQRLNVPVLELCEIAPNKEVVFVDYPAKKGSVLMVKDIITNGPSHLEAAQMLHDQGFGIFSEDACIINRTVVGRIVSLAFLGDREWDVPNGKVCYLCQMKSRAIDPYALGF